MRAHWLRPLGESRAQLGLHCGSHGETVMLSWYGMSFSPNRDVFYALSVAVLWTSFLHFRCDACVSLLSVAEHSLLVSYTQVI